MIMPSSSYQNPKARGVPLGGGIDRKASHPHNHKTCNGLGLGFELILAHLPLSIIRRIIEGKTGETTVMIHQNII